MQAPAQDSLSEQWFHLATWKRHSLRSRLLVLLFTSTTSDQPVGRTLDFSFILQ